MQTRFTIGTATVLMLVLLRLNIGWHFYSEGVKHLTEPNWSSEGFLRAAKGPLAPMFQSVLPGDYGFKAILNDSNSKADPAKQMQDRVLEAWGQLYGQFVTNFPVSENQKKDAERVLLRHQSLYQGWIGENKEAIDNWLHERDRLNAAKSLASANDVPYQKKRITDKQALQDAEAAGWLKNVRKMEQDLRLDLEGVLETDQLSASSLPSDSATLRTVDLVMTYGILTIGILLFLGLFTRLASIAGAAFLLSVVLTQPFWVTETTPTFNQLVEMFALLTLATTNVGRWAGLDFFIHYLLLQPACAAKGSSNESKS